MNLQYSIDQNNSAWRIVDGEAVLINAETTFYYGLNSTATRIWMLLLEEDLTVEEISGRIAPDFNKTSAEISEGIDALLQELAQEKLLTSKELSNAPVLAEDILNGSSSGPIPASEWDTPRITRYDTLESLVVCGE